MAHHGKFDRVLNMSLHYCSSNSLKFLKKLMKTVKLTQKNALSFYVNQNFNKRV